MRFPSFIYAFLFLLTSLFIPTPLPSNEPVEVTVSKDLEMCIPGEVCYLAFDFKIADGWKVYWKHPGGNGLATDLVIESASLSIDPASILWEAPSKFTYEGAVVYGYKQGFHVIAPVFIPETTKETPEIKIDISWLACSEEECLPGEETLSISLPLGKNSTRSQDYGKIHSWLKRMPEQRVGKSAIEEGHLWISLEGISTNAVNLFVASDCIEHSAQLKVESDDEGRWVGIALNEVPNAPFSALLSYVDPEDGSEKALDLSLEMPDAEMVAAMPASSGESLWWVFFSAFIGGMILNLMPCVLPVISLKILHFVEMSGHDKKKTLAHAGAFSLGVLISFWALALILLALRAAGFSAGWGFQLQEPTFIAFLAALLLAFALNLFGVFEFGFGLSGTAGSLDESLKKKGGYLGAFSSGILATAVATPCSGPFLGTALGVAVTLPYLSSLMVFTFLALGMVFPYILLASNPRLIAFLPKPGPWMETFRQIMGFLMLLTVIWLVWVFSAQTASSTLLSLMVTLFILSVFCWLYGKTEGRAWLNRLSLVGILLSAGFASYTAFNESEALSQESTLSGDWVAFSMEEVHRLREENTPVFIDFTAKWCLLCQSNHVVLEQNDVVAAFKEKGVIRMKADWTRKDEEISKALESFGRSSVPLYIYYPPGKKPPVVLSQVLSTTEIIETLKTQ